MTDPHEEMETCDKTGVSSKQATQDVRRTDIGHGNEISSVKLQPLWTASPLNWFRVAELQFETQSIKTEKTKFLHVLSALMPETCNLISDFLEFPPTTDQYQKLKSILLERLAPSEEQKLAQLLSGQHIGDGKPSEILRTIRSLSSTNLPTSIVRSFWIRRLPEIIRIALVAQPEEQPLEELAKMADRMHEVMHASHNISAIAGPSQKYTHSSRPTQRIEHRRALPVAAPQSRTVEDRLTRIEETLSELSQKNRSQSQGWRQRNKTKTFNRQYNRSNQRQRSPSRPTTNRYCILHYKYREKARNCYPPCSWVGNQPSMSHAAKNA